MKKDELGARGATPAAGPYASLVGRRGAPRIRIDSPLHGSWLVVPRPAGRTTIALRPHASSATLELLYPRNLSLSRLVATLCEEPEVFDGLIGRLVARHSRLAGGLVLPRRLALATRDGPIAVVRTEEVDGGEPARALRAEGLAAERVGVASARAMLQAFPGTIVLGGAGDQDPNLAYLLRAWLRHIAHGDILLFLLADPDLTVQSRGRTAHFPRPVDTVRVMDAASRWASMSRGRDGAYHLNINWRALLLERPLLRHLLCHELSHTWAMNHQEQFHAVLRTFSPDAEEKEKALDRAWGDLPLWTFGKTKKY